jgi:hypothetical protein
VLDARLPSVLVTAYNRPDGLARVLDDLEREGLVGRRVHIYDDASPHPDTVLERRITDLGCTLHRAERHHGKHAWWRWWNTILADLKSVIAEDELVLVLQRTMRTASSSWWTAPPTLSPATIRGSAWSPPRRAR